MNFDKLAIDYIKNFQKKCNAAWASGAGAIELSTRPVVHNFIEQLSHSIQPNVTVLHDTQLKSSPNKPDWRMEDFANFGTYCFGDHKNLSITGEFTLNTREEKQLARYLALGRPVFIFDGVEFLFYKDENCNPERISLIPKPLDPKLDWSSLPIEPSIEVRFREMLDNPGYRKWSENDIIQHLARRARLLSDAVQQLLLSPIDSGLDVAENSLIRSLHKLSELIQNHHDPGLADIKASGDFIAQVLAFGLFFAHTRAPDFGDSSEERRAHIHDFWLAESFTAEASLLRPFQSITELLGESLNADNDLSAWYHDSANLLAHAEYIGATGHPSDYHTLFEKFLNAFDREIRFDRGAFYTPSSLASWMARSTNQLVQLHFGGSICQIAQKIIDPCCGTGSILEAVITETQIPDDSISIFVGFEVLPAPYALSQYRLSKLTKGTLLEGKVKILLTDTLSDHLINPPSDGSDGFLDELAEARNLALPPLDVVIGNPPSSIHVASKAPRTRIEDMLSAFRPPVDMRGDRQNFQQAINNEAIRFLRWSAQKVIDSGRGVLTLVLPGSFAYSVSYKYARKWVVEQFQDIFVLVLDQDVRSGASGNSVFDVLQGRLVLLAVYNPDSKPANSGGGKPINYYDISKNKLDEKHQFLNNSKELSEDFTSIIVSEPTWSFLPTSPYPEDTWNSSWPLRDALGKIGIFKTKCSAVKLSPTSVLFHTEAGILVRRCRAISSQNNNEWTSTYDELNVNYWKGQRKPPNRSKFTNEVRESLGVAAATPDVTIKSYSYRPFIEGKVLDDENVFSALGKAPGDGTRARPEIRAAYSQGALGIALAPSTIDIGETLTRFVSFAWNLPDNDIAARGNAMIYCNLFPFAKQPQTSWDDSVHSNYSAEIENLFIGQNTSTNILYYVFAVMNCRSYLEVFEPVLFGPSDPDAPPRVPIANDAGIRQQLANLGQRIAECENQDMEVDLLPNLLSDWPDTLEEFRLKSYDIGVEEEVVTLIGEGGERIRIQNIPECVLSLHISGHPIVSKWLRERKFVYLRRTFRKPDQQSLLELFTRISIQFSLLDDVDTIVSKILSTGALVNPIDIA